jgi:peptide/nickel transport system substrate-binding protein
MRGKTLVRISTLIVVGAILASCAAPTPQVVEKTVEVEKVVEKTVEVEKVVEVTAVPEEEPTAEYVRSETLYTSGKQWGPPSNWNPIMTWAYAMGTLGFCYETPFLYDPLTDEFIPWLAENGEWTSDTVYEMKLREGINWSDGEPLTAEDFVFTFELGQFPSVPYSTLWNWMESAEAVDDYTVRFTFSEVNHQEWANRLYETAIVPKHLWEGRTEEEVATGANENPVGTGPYLYETHSESPRPQAGASRKA